MNTLMQAPVSTVLEQLLMDAQASEAQLHQQVAQLSPAERDTLMADARSADYLPFYERAKGLYLAVSRETGTLLYMLARMAKARTIVEFGTSFGVSTLHLAAALRDNGGGRLISTEFEAGKIEAARHTLARAGLDDLVEIRAGDALHTLAVDLPECIDLVLLDGAKALYPSILQLLEPRLAAGAVVVADNAAWSEDYLAHVRTGGAYLSQALPGDVEVSVKLDGVSAVH